jgi:Predicted membrane protein
VHAAPVLRGGRLARSVWLVTGLFLCACGIVCFLESRLGLPPWDVLHQGIANHTPLSFGVANELVGVVVLGLAWLFGSRPGPGTVANAVLIGLFIVIVQPLGFIQHLATWSLPARAGLLVAGMVFFGVGTAFYIGAAFGAGPRDSLMLIGAWRTHVRIGIVRTVLEGTALLAGFALGGRAGVGTLAFALLIGPSVEGSFWLISRTRLVT